MNDNDKPRFLQLIASLASLFSRELDDAAIELYWDAVSDLEIDKFASVVRELARTETFFPPPSRIRQTAEADDRAMAREMYRRVEKYHGFPPGFGTKDPKKSELDEHAKYALRFVNAREVREATMEYSRRHLLPEFVNLYIDHAARTRAEKRLQANDVSGFLTT